MNSGQIVQGKWEQLESDYGVLLGYILVGVVLNTLPRFYLAHIFSCRATFPKIWTYSPYHLVYRESPLSFNQFIFQIIKLTKNTIAKLLLYSNISFDSTTLVFNIYYLLHLVNLYFIVIILFHMCCIFDLILQLSWLIY